MIYGESSYSNLDHGRIRKRELFIRLREHWLYLQLYTAKHHGDNLQCLNTRAFTVSEHQSIYSKCSVWTLRIADCIISEISFFSLVLVMI